MILLSLVLRAKKLISTENCSQFKFHGKQREGVLLLTLCRRDNSPLKTTPLHLKQLIRILEFDLTLL